ncbi:threonine ammonia-lyase [Alkalibacillus haloalkaliphilus]|uniref:threonine ammonia-lyase n=1 Tax=Alkalibacillus haloalkaliphilus TaxID=94136 RepID=UPI0002FD9F29|nr:threonine/serine dehydratase [Alkalibacillus haloalkaliphilus]
MLRGQSIEKVSLDSIEEARNRIRKSVTLNSTLIQNTRLNQLYSTSIKIKHEGLQHTGSFKLRGAANKMSYLAEIGSDSVVVTASAGNHAIGLSYMGNQLGIPVHVFMANNAPKVKIDTCRNLGATVHLHGQLYDDAYEQAKQFNEKHEGIYVHPVADHYVVSGQGTIGLEVLEQVPDVEQVVVPIGGGGLISGIATALKSINPHIKVVGIQAENSNAFYRSIQEGHRVKLDNAQTIADGMSLKDPEPYLLEMVTDWVDSIETVTEEGLYRSIKQLLIDGKILVEGAGAATYAAVLEGKVDLNLKTVLISSGSNIDHERLMQALNV